MSQNPVKPPVPPARPRNYFKLGLFYLPLLLCVYSFFFGFPLRLRLEQRFARAPKIPTPADPYKAKLRSMMARKAPLQKISAEVSKAVAAGNKLFGPFGLRLVDDAVGTNRRDVLAMLIKRGAAINGVLESNYGAYPPPDRVSPLDDAVTRDEPEIAKMLLAAGAIPYELCPTGHDYDTSPYLDSTFSRDPRMKAVFKGLRPTEQKVRKYMKAEFLERSIPGLR